MKQMVVKPLERGKGCEKEIFKQAFLEKPAQLGPQNERSGLIDQQKSAKQVRE